MGLELDYKLCENGTCSALNLYDTTGAYDVDDNPTGYDQGETVANHPGTQTSLANGNFTIVTPGGASFEFDVTPTFPTTNSDLKIEIKATDLGYSDGKILDGVYLGTYKLVFDGSENGTFTKVKNNFFTCQAQCCVDKMYGLVKDTCPTCDTEHILQKAIEADGFLRAARTAFNCGKINLAGLLLKKVQYLCTNYNCKCC